MQKITGELIEKFFSGNCTEEEAKMVLQYLEENPNEIHLLHEWEETDSETPLPQNYSDEMLQAVAAATTGERPKGKIRSAAWLSIAACLLLAIAAWWLWSGSGKEKRLAEATAKPEILWIEKTNADPQDETVILPDSSRITLLQRSNIRYKKNFSAAGNREIYLTGEAVFDVKKDERKPFIVYSEGITTKDLGTIFRVKAYKDAGEVQVKLYEGKIVVNVNKSGESTIKDYLLSPGDELTYNFSNKKATIKRPDKKNKITIKDSSNNQPHAASITSSYMFNNQTLPEVLDALSAMYNVPVHYSKKELSGIYFIGKVEPSDPLEKILNDISVLNHLSVTAHEGAYIIKKKSTKH